MMAHRLVIKGGTVINADESWEADVLVEDGVVREISESIDSTGAQIIEAIGCWVTPGFVDLHTHLREPGRESAETIETGTRAAVLGGYTAVVAMPNTEPTTDNPDVVQFVQKRAAETALCEVAVSAAITVNRASQELVDFVTLSQLGVRFFTDDGSGVQDGALMRQALEISKKLDIVLAEHCEDSVLANEGLMHAGDVSAQLGIKGQPSEAEDVMVMRDIALARTLDARIHFLHLSTASSVAMVRAAKRAGVRVTAEVTPHHFSLTHEELLSRDPTFRVNPPLRREQDKVAVQNAIADETIDAIATDHAPHAPELKKLPLDKAPPGMIGLETALAVAITELSISPRHLVALMSTNPARIAQLDTRQGSIEFGRAANIAVVDPAAQWVVDPDQLASKSRNTPFAGRKLSGKVRHTLVNGELMVIDGTAHR